MKTLKVRYSASHAQFKMRVCILISGTLFFVQPSFSEQLANELSAAAQASAQGVPEVAVPRLRALLKNDLPDDV